MTNSNNVCYRCGKTRIFLKSWKEKVDTGQGRSTLTHDQYVCPDKECQQKVEQDIEEKRLIALEREAAHQQRLKDRNSAKTK
jgi:hypothetical protein